METKAELERKANKVTLKQRWIKLNSIETDTYSLIRLVISVNGANYSYPSKAVWAQIGTNKERFPLPITSDEYRVSFKAFLSDPGNVPTVEASTQKVDEFSIQQLPVEDKTFELYSVGGFSTVYETGKDAVQIKYSIE